MFFATAALRIGTRDVNNLLERHESKNVIRSEVCNLAVKVLNDYPQNGEMQTRMISGCHTVGEGLCARPETSTYAIAYPLEDSVGVLSTILFWRSPLRLRVLFGQAARYMKIIRPKV